MHKTQSFEVEESCPGPPQTPVADRLRPQGEEKLSPRSTLEHSTNQNVKYGGEAANPKSSSPFDVVELVSLSLSVCLRLSACLLVCLSACLSVCLSVCI